MAAGAAAGPSTIQTHKPLSERLRVLDDVEKQVAVALGAAADCVHELTKDKLASKNNLEGHSKKYREAMERIERELSAQIDYLSSVTVGAPHQASTFIPIEQTRLAEHKTQVVYGEIKKIADSIDTGQ